MLEAELTQAKEDTSSTVAKLREVEKMYVQLQQNFRRYIYLKVLLYLQTFNTFPA